MTTNTTNTAAIDNLRAFALANNELKFAHLCTAALNGEAWAMPRVKDTLRRIGDVAEYRDADQHVLKLACIRHTDTTRPDGAIARSFQP
jgi:hypothetical protein